MPITEFYEDKTMISGCVNQCKECLRKRARERRWNNLEIVRQKDRERSNLEKRKELRVKFTNKRRHEVEGYQKSHNAVNRAIERGEILRSNTCQICGEQNKKTEAHHDDYEQTKKVLWLCAICHRNYHTGKSEKAERIRKIVDILLMVRNDVYQECDEY